MRGDTGNVHDGGKAIRQATETYEATKHNYIERPPMFLTRCFRWLLKRLEQSE